jgi:flagellar hook-length control protein FliK
LEVSVQKGELRARIEAETPAARSLLLDNLPALREKLAEQNINIKQFDVDLTDRQPGGMSQQTFGQSNSDSQQRNRFSPRANLSESAAPVSASAPSTARRAGMGDGLNVIV